MKSSLCRLLQSPMFEPLHTLIASFAPDRFPTLAELNARLQHKPIKLTSGCQLSFVAQQTGPLAFEAQYEPRCYLMGEVQTRADNWHDLFNALVWLTFPNAKAAINARHYRALTADLDPEIRSERGFVRDTITLLDESGVIVAYSDDALGGLLRNFQWKELFWQQRVKVQASMGFFLLGHGLYEKALQPYTGMTAQGLLLKVEQVFFDGSRVQQLAYLDELLADYLADPEHCCRTRELSPVPLLGVPGWAEDNCSEAYYDNTAYFRPGRRV
jgi:hypothetical protein